MELDTLKSAWNDNGGKNKNTEELKMMLRENKHPVLRSIRTQLIIEVTAWAFFLLTYYNMFDGDRRPGYSNILLVSAVVLVLLHSITGYLASKNIVKGNDLKKSLFKYLTDIKIYAIVSVSSRAITIICVLLFFTSTITFTIDKYILLAAICLLICIQVYVLARIWSKRIKKIRATAESLKE
ncbi:MAG: hypothetical protein WKI04_00105 [Ferruginibacter sp.]